MRKLCKQVFLSAQTTKTERTIHLYFDWLKMACSLERTIHLYFDWLKMACSEDIQGTPLKITANFVRTLKKITTYTNLLKLIARFPFLIIRMTQKS